MNTFKVIPLTIIVIATALMSLSVSFAQEATLADRVTRLEQEVKQLRMLVNLLKLDIEGGVAGFGAAAGYLGGVSGEAGGMVGGTVTGAEGLPTWENYLDLQQQNQQLMESQQQLQGFELQELQNRLQELEMQVP